MFEGVGDGDPHELLPREAAERAAARREHQAAHLASFAAPEALVERRVLGVDRHDLTAAASTSPVHDGSPGDQALLVGEGESLSRLERADRRRKPGEAHHSIEDDVGVGQRGELAQDIRPVDAAAGAISRNAELGGLAGEQLVVATSGERNDFVAVAVFANDVERLGADRPGGPKDRDANNLTHAKFHASWPRAGQKMARAK